MKDLEEPGRIKTIHRTIDIPITKEEDILVVEGAAGIAAGLASVRVVRTTLIVEQFNCPGGIATSGGHVCLYPG